MASNEKKDLVTGNRYVKYEGPITSIQKSWPSFEVFTYKQTDGQTKNYMLPNLLLRVHKNKSTKICQIYLSLGFNINLCE